MAKFDYKKWIIENKHNSLTEQTGSTTGSYTGNVTSSMLCYGCMGSTAVQSTPGQFGGWPDNPQGCNFYYGSAGFIYGSVTQSVGQSTCPGTGSFGSGSGTGSTSTTGSGMQVCYGCVNGQVVNSGGIQFNVQSSGYCGTMSNQGVTTTYYYPQTHSQLANCTTTPTGSTSTTGSTIPSIGRRGDERLRGERDYNEGRRELRESFIPIKKTNNKIKKSELASLIKESIRELLLEQHGGVGTGPTNPMIIAECTKWQSNAPTDYNYFIDNCCEEDGDLPGCNPNGTILCSQAYQTQMTFAPQLNSPCDCCEEDTGYSGDNPCNDDPLWVNMPMGSTTGTLTGKFDYCMRCAQNSSNPSPGNPQTGNFPVNLTSNAPWWNFIPGSGTNYCMCCDASPCTQTITSSDPQWGDCIKCFAAQTGSGSVFNASVTGQNCECCDEGPGIGDDPCQGDAPSPECYWCPGSSFGVGLSQPPDQCQTVGGMLGTAIANGFTLYSDMNVCTSQEANCIDARVETEQCHCCKIDASGGTSPYVVTGASGNPAFVAVGGCSNFEVGTSYTPTGVPNPTTVFFPNGLSGCRPITQPLPCEKNKPLSPQKTALNTTPVNPNTLKIGGPLVPTGPDDGGGSGGGIINVNKPLQERLQKLANIKNK